MTRLPDRMWAAWIDEPGPPEAIRYGELPVPAIGPGDVLVRVEAVAVDPVDTFVRSGAFRTPLPFPFVIGRDLVGTVAACGSSGVTGFACGDRVWCSSLGHAGRQGAAAQFAVVPANRLYRLPESVDTVNAVAVAHPAATAYLALTVHAGLTAGETVFIGGGAGHVGRAAVVMAARAGARVIASCSAADLGACRLLGASVALDYRDPRLGDAVLAAAPDGVDVCVDTSGSNAFDVAVPMMARGGRIVVMAAAQAQAVLPVRALYQRDVRLVGFVISNASVADLAAAARRVGQLLAEGALAPHAVEELPLESAEEAHRRMEAGEVRGTRLVLRPPA